MRNKQRPEFIDNFLETFRENGRILTTFAVILIVVSGISIVDNPDRWWITPSAILLFLTTIFLFMNARTFVKIVFVIIMNLFLSVFAFQAGSYIAPTTGGGLLWMASTMFIFFALLSFSYITHSGKSRWGTLGISSIIGFITTYLLSITGMNMLASAIIGVFASTIHFVFFYKFTTRTQYKKSLMPTNHMTTDIKNHIRQGLSNYGWKNTEWNIDEEKNTGGIITWKEKAYLLYPIFMESEFTMTGKRASTLHLGYKDHNITQWLSDIVFTNIPSWITRGAPMTLVLLDMNNANGQKPHVIGVSQPDTKRKIPVGIVPAKNILQQSKAMNNILTNIEKEIDIFTKPLNKKQEYALSRIGKIDEKKQRKIIDPPKKKMDRITVSSAHTKEAK